MPPKFGALLNINPNNTEPHIIIIVPQNQFRQSLFLFEFAKIDTPDNTTSPENMNEKTPKPLYISNSLIQAPILLNQFSVCVERFVKSFSVLWSFSPVNKYDRRAINNKIPIIVKKLPITNLCELLSFKLILEIRFFWVLFVGDLAITVPIILTKIQITNFYPINGGLFVFNFKPWKYSIISY